MSVMELAQSALFLVDKHGNRLAVQLDYAIWEELLAFLQDIEDAKEIPPTSQRKGLDGKH